MILVADPILAWAQRVEPESRPAVMPFGAGALGADGAAAIGAGLRLFPAPGQPAAPLAPQPAPAPASMPLPSGPVVKPGLGALPQAMAGLAKPLPLPSQRPAALRSPTAFATNPAVSQRVRQQMLAAALPTSPNPAGLRQSVDAGLPWQEFDRLLQQHGYDPRDLADVVAAFYLIAWEVATGGDATLQPAGIAAVRGQARQMLAGTPRMAGMSEAERQETAETLAFHAMAIAARHHDLQAAGAGRAIQAFRTEVAESVAQQQGIDLRRFALTPAGFEAR
jgi:hypothetical protein